MRDMKEQYRQQGRREDYVKVEEKAVVPSTYFGKSSGANEHESGDGHCPKYNVPIPNPLEEEVHLDVKVQVHCCMDGEERDEYSSKKPMVGVEFLMGHASQILNRTPRFGSKQIV